MDRRRACVGLLASCAVLTGMVLCSVLDLDSCEERRGAGLCAKEPLETARLCPEECEGHLVQSRVRRRVLVDEAVPDQVCGVLLRLQRAIRPGDGYGGQKHPHTPHEFFGGITPRAAAHWAVSLPDEADRINASGEVLAFIQAAGKVKDLAAQALADVDPNLTELFLDFVQLACRERVIREDLATPDGEALPDSMAIHADNCWRDPETGNCRRERPFFHWRTHSAHLYLDSPGKGFEGGEFFFADSWDAPLHGGRRTEVPPSCGRLLAFSAGLENLHGVKPLNRGRRCALSIWMTTDAGRAGSTAELELASAVLAGEATPDPPPAADVEGYYENCTGVAASAAEVPVLDEVKREVAGLNMTFQVLSHEPQVTRVLDFVTADEAERLIALASPQMAPSLVFDSGELTTRNYRTSQTAWLADADIDNGTDLENLTRRIELLTGLALESAESVQIAFYPGETQGKYEPHMDWGLDNPEDVRRDFSHAEAPGGRLATFLLFLNDVPHGGHTVFTSLGLHVKPKAGSALFWFNLMPGQAAGLGDMQTRHGGCPVLRGLKYIATKWIHERGNEELLKLPADSAKGHLWRDWRTLNTSIRIATSVPEDDAGEAAACTGEGGSEQCSVHRE